MRFASVRTGSTNEPGVLDDAEIVLIGDLFVDLTELIEAGDDGLDAAARAKTEAGRTRVPLETADLAAPIGRFKRDVLCTGWNYRDHFDENKGRREGQEVKRPTTPTYFTKSPNTVIGPNDSIAWDGRCSKKWDYEAELVLVIGKPGRSIPPGRPMSTSSASVSPMTSRNATSSAATVGNGCGARVRMTRCRLAPFW